MSVYIDSVLGFRKGFNFSLFSIITSKELSAQWGAINNVAWNVQGLLSEWGFLPCTESIHRYKCLLT